MFGTPWLDRFTRVHVAVVPVVFIPVIVAFAILVIGTVSAFN